LFQFRDPVKANKEFYFNHERGIYRRNSIFDKLIFNKIRAGFGGQIARLATGSAPISEEVLIFSKAVFGCPIPEGYGQTEATAAITFTHPLDPNHGIMIILFFKSKVS
jgi:long-chain acyl-CoA synthetase